MEMRRALESFVLQKKLNPRKLRNLVSVATTAERLATKPYIEKRELDLIVDRFGVGPDVTTWGDFFASEIATDHWEKADAEFEKICETVIFDFIAACMVFPGRTAAFIESVMHEYHASLGKGVDLRNAEDQEKIHLGILAGYYEQMGLTQENLADTDTEFFDSFSVRTRSA